MAAKPPYQVPTLRQVARLRGRNGLMVASTFSGCGGSCLGFEMAGYRVAFASEFVAEARDTYRLNHPGVPVDERDVRRLSAEDLLAAAGVERGELDVLEGSPPCSAFSSAGKRQEGWGKTKAYSTGKQQVVDDLFFEFIRLVDGCRPRAFVAENVAGLAHGAAKGYLKAILRRMREAGYVVQARLLDAQWLGVPQARRRLIFVGLRADLGLSPTFPAPLPYRYSLADALGSLVYRFDTQGQFAADEHPGTLPAHTITTESTHHVVVRGDDDPVWRPDGTAVDPETGERIDLEGTALGREWDRRRAGGRKTAYCFGLVAARPSSPSPTVTSAAVTSAAGSGPGTAGVTYDDDGRPRKFTLAELRRVCGFPDDFALTGTYRQRWERLGRAVPPPMMRAVAASLAEVLS